MFTNYIQNADPDRPKNDKATILTDTVQELKDLTAEVGRLKAECAALTEEAREVMLSSCYLKVLKPIYADIIPRFSIYTANTGEE